MASTRFTVLTGHLSQYSLADLIGILRHQRKTGRLLIEYMGSPAILFFKDGDLVDAQYNTLIGVQAIFVSFVQPAAAFNFNPLIQPTRFSIDSEQQRVILELLGCWTEEVKVVRSAPRSVEVPSYEVPGQELQSHDVNLLLTGSLHDNGAPMIEGGELLALPAGPPQQSTRATSTKRPLFLAMGTFVLLLVFGLPTLIAISNKARKPVPIPTAQEPGNVLSNQVAQPLDAGKPSLPYPESVATAPGILVSPKREREQPSNQTPSETATKEVIAPPATDKAVTQSSPDTVVASPAEKTKQPETSGQTVKVVMRIENGRVVQATIGDRRPGSEAYESLALRIARQRRYPTGVNKQETLIMKVDGQK